MLQTVRTAPKTRYNTAPERLKYSYITFDRAGYSVSDVI